MKKFLEDLKKQLRNLGRSFGKLMPAPQPEPALVPVPVRSRRPS
ncbi:hypothetical protein HNR42_000353 [Deinobacterium chartae]|uniref:Uncharacterized protein n=1 Tax=Deinobacterium chartae TaxID=521158 RepID=A0A841HU31_9DEIO|nr:hypothetical protein [Deinobacterium chartae]